MNKTLALSAIVMFAVVMGVASITPAVAAKNKVDVCHFAEEEIIQVDTDGDGIPDTEETIPEHWQTINISANGNAVNAHLDNHTQEATGESDFVIEDEDDALRCADLMEAYPAPE